MTDRSRLAVLALTLLYTLGFLLWYARTPLGRVPVLDAVEVIELARQIADGTLPHEAFYRAPLYSALLALLLKLGVALPFVPDFARLINGACHVIAALAVYDCALALWRQPRAALLAGALYGLYPVALYFAGDAGDTSLGIALAMLGVRAALTDRPTASLWLALATLARPHYLPVLLAWVAWSVLRRRGVLAALLGAALPLAAMGAINARLSGDFALLPWQGGFALWAANGPNANGRFFAHSIAIADAGARYENPARIEAETLYRAETGSAPPADYRAIARYWRARAVAFVLEHPARFATLLGNKLLYLANDAEQYNNKTYAVHKALSPWLAPNPLGWSLLLALALAGALLARQPRALALPGGLLAAYLAGVLVYFVSDRFRLPAVPLLAMLAGGIVAAPWAEMRARLERRAAWLAGALALVALTFVPIPESQTRATAGEDYAMLAKAATDLGRHREAMGYAMRALALIGAEGKAPGAACVTRFNVWLSELPVQRPTSEWLRESRALCTVSQSDDLAKFMAGAFAWSVGEREPALARWRDLVARRSPHAPSAQAALLMAGALPRAALEDVAPASAPPLLAAALAARGSDAWRARLEAARGSAGAAREIARVEALFAAAPP